MYEKAGQREGPRVTFTAVNHMKPWSNPLEDVSVKEDHLNDEI